ncbi:hypothetical protein [Sphingomonas sp. 28-62-11]|uniref:hypothetical protein n=1 Tax=Sphingomonas sp. 28-62-11 TaxID=1970432 RepID=UPI0035A941A9
MPSDDPEAPASTPQAYARAPSSRAPLIGALIAFVLGIAVTALFVTQYRQWLPRGVQGMFEATPAPTAATTEDPGTGFMPPPEAGSAARLLDSEALNARQAAIAAQLATLEARAETIDRDSHAAANNAARAEALLIAFSARRAIDRGLALGSIEPQLQMRFGVSQPRAVGAIVQASRTPVTLEDLRLALDASAPELTTGVATTGWWPSLRREISSLVVIRHEGTPSPRAADRLARVRRLLDAGQVEAALVEVARLPGAPKASSWIAAARRFVAAHQALDTIETAAILGQGLEAPASPTAAVGSSTPVTETTATAALTE